MVLPGARLLARKIVKGAVNAATQTQPCGVDLSLRRVMYWTTPATLGYMNTKRETAATQEVSFDATSDALYLAQGAYLVEFNETVSIPLNGMGQLYTRSSLWRSGATIHAGVVDAGYEGAMGALLEVHNPHGITLEKDARLAQIVLHELQEAVEKGYSGVYQNSGRIGERHSGAHNDKPYRAHNDGPYGAHNDDRPYRAHNDRPYRPQNDRQPYRAQNDKPYRAQNDRPYGAQNDRKPYRTQNDDRESFRTNQGFRPRAQDGSKPFRRHTGQKPTEPQG